jgi:hypothetical protein
MTGIIILIVTVVCMLAIAVFVISQAQKPKVPYKQFEQVKMRNYSIYYHADIQTTMSVTSMSSLVIDKTIALCSVVTQKKIDAIRVVFVHSQKEWDDYAVEKFGARPESKAVLVATPQMFGSGAPMIIVKNIFGHTDLLNLVAHEVMHIFFEDRDHASAKIWFNAGGKESLENKLYEYVSFLTLLDEVEPNFTKLA